MKSFEFVNDLNYFEKFSIPVKITKGTDRAITSPNHSRSKQEISTSSTGLGFSSSPSVSRASTHVIRGQDDLRNDSQPYMLRTSSPGEYNHNVEGSSKALKSNSEVRSNGQFHFSMYKWPRKEVSLATYLRGGNNITSKVKVRSETEGIEEELVRVEPIVSSSSGKGVSLDSSSSSAQMDIGLLRVESKTSHHAIKDEINRQGNDLGQLYWITCLFSNCFLALHWFSCM